jgi:hypothetical protein
MPKNPARVMLPDEEQRSGSHGERVGCSEDAHEMGFVGCGYHRAVEKRHSRVEIRECWATAHPRYLNCLYRPRLWLGPWTLVMARLQRRIEYEKHAAASLAYSIALNLLKRERSAKRSICRKCPRAGWDEAYLSKVLCESQDVTVPERKSILGYRRGSAPRTPSQR